MLLAVEESQGGGVGVVAVRDSTDWNMISYVSRQALEPGCISIVQCHGRT